MSTAAERKVYATEGLDAERMAAEEVADAALKAALGATAELKAARAAEAKWEADAAWAAALVEKLSR